MKKNTVFIYLILLFLMVHLPLFENSQPVSAQTPPPATGQWIISDSTTINDATIVLNGNLVITTSGSLNMNNCVLIMNCTPSKTYSIYIDGGLMSGGTFNVEDTTIKAANSNYPYSFQVNMSATMNMDGCTVKNLGGELNLTDPISSLGGIVIHSGNVLIEDTNITDYETIGVMVMPYAAPTIRNCNISMPINLSGLALTVGILDSSVGMFSPNYLNNYISGNLISGIVSVGIPVMNNFATISGNTLEANTGGVACWGTSPDIIHNKISYSVSGITVINPCTPAIHNNTINQSGTGVLLYNGTEALVHHNNLSDNLVYGISIIGADPEVYNNDIHDNLIGGIYLDDSYSVAHHNIIYGQYPSSGIIILNDSAPNIYLNEIYGDEYSIGIFMNGNISEDPILDRNTVRVGANGTCVDITGFEPIVKDNIFYFSKGANGLNASGSSASLLRNEFNANQGAYSAFIRSSTVTIDDNDFIGGNIGVYANDCTPTLTVNSFVDTSNFGILFEESTSPVLEDNSFNEVNNNTPGKHDNIEMEVRNCSSVSADIDPSYLRLLNSSYNLPDTAENSKIQVDWFLDVYVKMPDNSPAEGVGLNLLNISGDNNYFFTTDSEGKSLWNEVTEIVHLGTVTETHSPYNVKVRHNKLMDNETVVLNMSKTVNLKLGYNQGPKEPFNITPKRIHNLTPLIKWNPSIDPEGDPIFYYLDIGTSQGAEDILADHNTSNTFYQVQSPFTFREYHIALSAHTPDGNSSAVVQTVLDVFNNPPVLSPIGDLTIYLDLNPTLEILLSAVDPDTDPVDTLLFNASTSLFTVDPASGEVHWTAEENDIGTHVVNFTVSDGYITDFELVTITVGYWNLPPNADAGENITAYVNDMVYLNASGSYDPDGHITEFQWTPSSSSVLLDTTNPVRPWFKATMEGNYSFDLKVMDDKDYWSQADTVWVLVLPEDIKPSAKEPGIILKNASVSPSVGKVDDKFIFSVTLKGVNANQELTKQLNESALIQLEIDNKITLVVPRIGNPKDISTGILYSLVVEGSVLGEGDHTYRFICSYDNVSGDIGIFNGPRVKKDTVSEDEKGLGNLAVISIAVALIIISCLFIFMMIFRKRLNRTDKKPGDEDKEIPERGKPPLIKAPMEKRITKKKKIKKIKSDSETGDLEWDDSASSGDAVIVEEEPEVDEDLNNNQQSGSTDRELEIDMDIEDEAD